MSSRHVRYLRLLAIVALASCESADQPMVPEAPVLESTVPNSYGTVTLCKQTDGGIAAGTPYEFTVTLNGVVRKLTVPVGRCLELVVPRSAAALSKGYYRTHADLVAALLPTGAKLRVDGGELTGDQVMAIFAAPARGSADVDVGGSTILLNLVQQLLAADLNLLQGVQPTPAVLDAVAAANAGLTITIVGGVVRITSSLSQTDISRLVDVLTRFNDGKIKGTSPTPTTAELRVVETLPSQVTLASIVCAPTTGCTNANLATASVTVLASAGSVTTVTYKNNSQTLGTLRLCKVAGTGIEAGAPFEFRVGATDEPIEAGSCEDFVLPFNNTGDSDGRYGIFEHGCGDLCLGGDDGFAVTAIDCSPTARCGSPSLTGGTIRVGLAAGQTSIVTFTNRSTLGTLRLCKTAGAGVSAGTVFRFRVAGGGDNLAVTANGDCREFTLGEDSGDSDKAYEVSEYGCGPTCVGDDQGFAVSSIVCQPADKCPNPALGLGTVRVGIVGAQTTTVTFTNRSTRGTLRVCKVAGAGIQAGTGFGFRVGGVGDVTIAAGSCSDYTLPEQNTADSDGNYGIFEFGCGPLCLNGDQGFAVTSITCSPAANCASPSLTVGSVRADVVATQTTTVTYTNRSTVGTLRLCKVAGAGITAGSPFSFVVSGQPNDVVVNAGSCVDLAMPETNTGDSDGRYGIFERGCGALCFGGDQGFVVTSIVCLPADRCASPSTSVGTVRVGLAGAQITTVTFTNAASDR